MLMVRSHPRPPADFMENPQVKDYLEYDLYKNFRENRSLKKVLRYPLIEDHLARYEWAKDQVYGKVLDLGCGSGFGSEVLAESEKVRSVTGVDIRITGTSHSKKVSFVELDILDGDLPCGNYDCVVAFEFVEHFDSEKIKKVFSNIKSVCNDKTQVFISTPNHEAFSPLGRKWLPYHPIEYTLPELKKLVVDNGFEVEEVYMQRPLIKFLHKLAAQIILFKTRFIKNHSIENKKIKILFAIFSRVELFLGRGVFCKFLKSDSLYAKYLILKVRKLE